MGSTDAGDTPAAAAPQVRADAAPPYPQLVFSGGGTRCFWQGGFLEVAAERLVPDPVRIAAVSGGALSAAAFVTGRERRLLDTMAEAFAAQDGNIQWHERDPDTGVTPHQRLYREVVNDVLGDNGAARAVADGPALQVLLGHPPMDSDSVLVGTVSALIHQADLHLRSTPHLEWAEKAGLTSTLVDIRRAARDGRLVELICVAATIPPIFEVAEWDGRPVIDGGMADHAPMPEPDDGRTLVLSTRVYRNVPDAPDRTYVQPSGDTPADKIDFTDPDKIRDTWEMGARDARDYLDSLGT